MIEVNGLSKSYGTHRAVNDVSFNISKGEVVGFLGPNGAGKSTIMNILTGYISLSEGEVKIDGFDILENPENAKRRIGYLPEIPPLYVDMTVREYLYFIYDLKKVKFPKAPHIAEIMQLVGLEDVAGRLIKNLSKGYRQRVGFAQALVGNPDVLILDEPTVGLDPKQIIEIRNLISKLGTNHTIILSSHILSEIQAVCERVIIINKGNIVADDTLENLSRELSKDSKLVLSAICDGEKTLEAIKAVEGVEQADMSIEEDTTVNFVIKPIEDADIRANISKTGTDLGGTILSFKVEAMTLEQIFLSLTEEVIEEEYEKEIIEENEEIIGEEEAQEDDSDI